MRNEAGFKLEEIKEIRRSGKKDRVLLKKRNEILEEMARLTAKLAKLEGYMNEESMSIDVPVRVRTIPETVTAVKRCRISTGRGSLCILQGKLQRVNENLRGGPTVYRG